MEKIKIESEITEYMSKNKFNIIDALSKKYVLSSYEEYITCFNLITSTYKDNISEYFDEGKKYLNNMEEFINNIIENETEDNIKSYITKNLSSKLGFNNGNKTVNLICIHPSSFLIQKECSKETFLDIYEELGYDMLKEYIRLVKQPSNFSSFINDSNKQIVAMKFLLYKTNLGNSVELKKDKASKTMLQLESQCIQDSISEITTKKDDFIHYMDEEKEHYKNWFEEITKNVDDFQSVHSNKLSDIEKTYESKLKIEEPAKFMLEQSQKYKKSTVFWCAATVILSIVLLVLLAFILSPQISFNDKLITINILSSDMPIYSSVVLLAMISLVIYVLRIFIKMAISSKHLMEEYKQKYSLTYFYLSLVNNGNIDNENAQNIILTSLFTKADTGLIKNDNSSNELDKTLSSTLK